MATTAEIAKRYFQALAAHDLDAAVACWAPGAVDRIVGQQDLLAPDGIRAYFEELFGAFPDFTFEIVESIANRDRCAISWRARGTFAGPGRFRGLEHNAARVELDGCDLLVAADDLLTRGDAYLDSGAV